jgi:hypothetical protein
METLPVPEKCLTGALHNFEERRVLMGVLAEKLRGYDREIRIS